ncbi:uncharacterized protein zgc:113425 isoform X2 [Cololabis saira]|uniref:uncharacterized protein zgc:113425 isoform X2 n=1 Tax=Cololabis saira TaxID=129043 RepID=UPI002AD4D1D0|nr:uncharacterized protein zgc:113425 isoform X2 [Cololabis saira]
MDRYRYFIFNQRSVLVLGVLQVACAGLCAVCGVMDAAFRRNTPLSGSRTPLWGALVRFTQHLYRAGRAGNSGSGEHTVQLSGEENWVSEIMASPGVLALFASQKKNALLVWAMLAAAGLSCAAAVVIGGYSSLTLTYGEEDEDVFHHHDSPHVTFVLHRMVKGANATILLSCSVSLLLSGLIAYAGCRSLPRCRCYDSRTGLETLVPQSDPGDTEMVVAWQGGDGSLFNSPAQPGRDTAEEEEAPSSGLPPYSRLA